MIPLKRDWHRIAEAMVQRGGGFAQALAEAWFRGDHVNKERIQVSFSDLFDKYEKDFISFNDTEGEKKEVVEFHGGYSNDSHLFFIGEKPVKVFYEGHLKPNGIDIYYPKGLPSEVKEAFIVSAKSELDVLKIQEQ